jgi:uncharacterized membrane protein (DUF485 family)
VRRLAFLIVGRFKIPENRYAAFWKGKHAMEPRPSPANLQHIRVDPKFRELELRRSRLVWLSCAIVLAAYYGLMVVVAFWPHSLHAPLGEGQVVTIGVPIGTAVIVLSWLLMGFYVYRANTFDALNEQILREVRS